MGASLLSSRAIIGEFFMRLAQDLGASWVSRTSRLFPSNQESETYAWLGQVPSMREWIGGRQPKGFTDKSYTIKNKKYESTLDVLCEDIRRDKTGQIMIRVGEQVTRANAHWAKLLSALIVAGDSTVCYDGEYFFDTDHSEGDSGSQSNAISVDISALAANVHGSTTVPSIEEMQQCIIQAIIKMCGYLDNEGEPLNEGARNFTVMTPVSLYQPALAAIALPNIAANVNNVIQAGDFSIQVAPNARLDAASWTASFAVFNTDGDASALICQEELPVQVSAIAEGSEYEFKEDKWMFGIMASRNVGYGFWQKAVKVTMT